MTVTVSPLAPKRFPRLPPVGGVEIAGIAAGLRYRQRPDLLLARLAPGTRVAGVFTSSSTRSPAVEWSAGLLASPSFSAPPAAPVGLVVNAGNANAFTGARGTRTTREMAELAAAALGTRAARVFVASTGVIGEPLDIAPIRQGVEDAARALSGTGWRSAAEAIRTTDTFPKAAHAAFTIDGLHGQVAGIAKGSGMIAPNLATMLAFVFADADVTSSALQRILAEETATTFNAITVDGDCSTSDSLLLMATGTLGNRLIEDPDAAAAAPFRLAVRRTLLSLAQQVVRDGEGASKFIAVTVTGAASDDDAKRAAASVANSPLVKTAAAGEDPNWGRIVMAAGKSGAALDASALSIRMGGIEVARAGAAAPGYREADGAAYMKNAELEFRIDLGTGGCGSFTMWTCDLTARYVEINADYRS